MKREFETLNISVFVISDSRDERSDRSGKVLEKRNPNAFRRVFSPVSGADVNIMVVFSGFDEFGAEWGSMDTTWEEDYKGVGGF